MDVDAAKGEQNPFEAIFPDPLRGVVNHAERFSIALSLVELDESRGTKTGPRELSLSETWVVGRADEIKAFVGDVVRDWSAGALSTPAASVTIERYLTSLHRYMAIGTALGEPTCCSPDSVTEDFFVARSLRAMGYPRVTPPAPPLVATT